MSLKITTIVGARPQFIKAAVVTRAIRRHNEGVSGKERTEEFLLHTGQHFHKNMSDVFFEELGLPEPDRHLGVHGLPHGAMTGRMMEGIEKALLERKPDIVLVYGDTDSTLAGALASVKLNVPVAHVEAGLRSFNRSMPEEHNRVLTDHVSSFLFCPTEGAVENLKREGLEAFPGGSDSPSKGPEIHRVGDVMYDAVLHYGKRARERAARAHNLAENELEGRPFALVTVHRAENTDDPERFGSIVEALSGISRELDVVWPVHPRAASKLEAFGISPGGERVRRIEPVGYLDMLELLRYCRLVLTDSGGLQKEAYWFGKPCVTLRDETEWVELVEHGFNRVAGATRDGILAAFHEAAAEEPKFAGELYGDGRAGEKIVSILATAFG